MCDSTSANIVEFVPYYGKFTTDGLVIPDLPITSRIVLDLCGLGLLSSSVNGTGYQVFTDCFNTSLILCEELRKMSFHLTEIVMVSRKGMIDDIAKTKCKTKQHEVVTFRKNDEIMALQ